MEMNMKPEETQSRKEAAHALNRASKAASRGDFAVAERWSKTANVCRKRPSVSPISRPIRWIRSRRRKKWKGSAPN